MGGVVQIYFFFCGWGEGEELREDGSDGLYCGGGDAVVFDVQEADFCDGVAELGEEEGFGGGVAGEGEVEDGDGGEV